MYTTLARAALVAFVSPVARAAPTDCALFGADFPAPRAAASDPSIAEAVASLQQNFASSIVPTGQAYSVAIFSLHSNDTLWEYHHTPTDPIGVEAVNGDSIYRIGSISKVFTVWTMLIELGDRYLDRSIVDFVPELEPFAGTPCPPDGMQYDDIDHIRWKDITLRDLASHASGIPRGLGESEFPKDEGVLGGLPLLDPSKLIECSSPDFPRPCTSEDFFKYVTQQSPSFPSAHSPAYSNNAYFLLAAAFKNITSKDLSAAMDQDIFQPLGMTHTTFSTPETTDFGVVPKNDTATWGWSHDIGIRGPGGGLFSSTNDMVRAGRALLSSSLLPPAQTRHWFDFVTQTAYLNSQVGTPWELTNLQDNSTGRLVTLHTKGGDLDYYHAKLVLSRAHDIGYVVLTAGTANVAGSDDIRGPLTNAIGNALIPAMEAAARREAMVNYAGTYIDEPTNTSVVISVDGDRMGLRLGNWISNGISAADALSEALGFGELSPRLYPTTLKSMCAKDSDAGQYVCRTGWRTVFVQQTQTNSVMDPCLGAWGLVDALTWGGRGVDDWVFNVGEDGKAVALEFRAASTTLKRTA
ncbi:beta-lactamase/transpeptidase-like protein [Thozetella sp. PMI_491]|nr:beta-lactamase/transpeptidase-like protein [Thozetella sp. PMI_491]